MRPRLTYANVMSTLCFFLLLGGGAYAAGHLGKNTVGSKQLKKNAVTTAKINDGAVTGSKIALASLGTVPSASRADTATNAATATNALKLGGVSADEYQPTLRHAVIELTPSVPTATVLSGNATNAGRVGDGKFFVDFAPDVRNCTVLANLQAEPGFATARSYNGSDPNAVQVDTFAWNSGGGPSDPPDGTTIDVAVIC